MTKLNLPMTPEEKIEYKKSVARMMVFWIINTRRSWRKTVLDNEPDEWKKLSLTSEFKNDDGQLNEEWLRFFNQVHDTVNSFQVRESLGVINALAEARWVEGIDPDCPKDEVLDIMYDETAEYIDDEPGPDQ